MMLGVSVYLFSSLKAGIKTLAFVILLSMSSLVWANPSHAAPATAHHVTAKKTVSAHAKTKQTKQIKHSKHATSQKKNLKKKKSVSRKKSKTLKNNHSVIHHAANLPNIQTPNIQTPTIQAPAKTPLSVATAFSTSVEQRLVSFVKRTVQTLRFSSYKFGGKHFDTNRGVYVLDCSSYVDNVLETVNPEAYSNLIDWSGSPQPTTRDYYQFFNNLSIEMDNRWKKVEDIDQLQGGDILVFRYKNNHGHETGGGHVMIIMDKPQRDNNIVWLKVADSASARHSNDTRPERRSGIGIGTILLKIDPHTFQPSAYAWNLGARWKNVKIAMARPASSPSSPSYFTA